MDLSTSGDSRKLLINSLVQTNKPLVKHQIIIFTLWVIKQTRYDVLISELEVLINFLKVGQNQDSCLPVSSLYTKLNYPSVG